MCGKCLHKLPCDALLFELDHHEGLFRLPACMKESWVRKVWRLSWQSNCVLEQSNANGPLVSLTQPHEGDCFRGCQEIGLIDSQHGTRQMPSLQISLVDGWASYRHCLCLSIDYKADRSGELWTRTLGKASLHAGLHVQLHVFPFLSFLLSPYWSEMTRALVSKCVRRDFRCEAFHAKQKQIKFQIWRF